MRGLTCLIVKILFPISLLANIALYMGWIDVGQYRNYVDKTIQTGKNIYNDPSTQAFLTSAKEKLVETYGEDFDNLKETLKNYTKEQATEYLQENYSGLNLEEIEQVVEAVTTISDATSGTGSTN